MKGAVAPFFFLEITMGMEHERKFLVDVLAIVNDRVITSGGEIVPDGWESIRQGYLLNAEDKVVRVRVSTSDYNSFGKHRHGTLTVKVAGPTAISRSEYEYTVDPDEAEEMLQHCLDVLEKTRYTITDATGQMWELDVFGGINEGLAVAEIELTDPTQAIALPVWVGREVTSDPRYLNSNLINSVAPTV